MVTDRDLLESMSEQIGKLVHHVAEVRSSNKRLEEELSLLRASATTMQSDIDMMKADIDVMKADIDVMKADIDHMKLDIAAMKLDIVALKDDVRRLESKVDEVDQRFDGRTAFLSSKVEHFTGFLYAQTHCVNIG